MNYYQHHIGDCAKEVGGMSALEVGIYALLRDWYYDAEQPIPAARVYRIARANSDVEKSAVDVVLSELFRLEDDIWRKPDIDAQIEDANRRINTARANGAKGGRPKKTASVTDGQPSNIPPETHPVSAASESQTGCKAHQSPITNHQTPSTSNSVPDGTGAAGAAGTAPAIQNQALAMSALEAVAIMRRTEGDPLTEEDEKLLWAGGRALFALSNISAENAGKFVGKLVKDNANDRAFVFDVMRAACLERPIDPRGWMTATCLSRRGKRAPPNRQEAQEQRNHAAADDWATEQLRKAGLNDQLSKVA